MLISQAALQRANGGLAVDLTGTALEQGDQEAAAHIASGGTTPAPRERSGTVVACRATGASGA